MIVLQNFLHLVTDKKLSIIDFLWVLALNLDEAQLTSKIDGGCAVFNPIFKLCCTENIWSKITDTDTMLQDTSVNTMIMRVSATDVDDGDNREITYQLKSERYPADLDYFG